MFERFVGDARRVALEATSVAAGLGSPSVEAEHLLVSIAASPHRAGDALRDVGLDSAELRDAIQRDFERVLGRVGIDASNMDISANCRRTKPRWGASAKQGLERALDGGQAPRRPPDRLRAHPARAAAGGARHGPAAARGRGHRSG